jgi:hypothetical protein
MVAKQAQAQLGVNFLTLGFRVLQKAQAHLGVNYLTLDDPGSGWSAKLKLR